MARVRTGTAERTAQKRATQDQVAAELGRPVTQAEAVLHRRKWRTADAVEPITVELALNLEELTPLGQLLGQIKDFRIHPGGYASLNLATNGREFGILLQEAALKSGSHLLVCDLYLTPRPKWEDDNEDGDDGDEGDAEAAYTSRVGG